MKSADTFIVSKNDLRIRNIFVGICCFAPSLYGTNWFNTNLIGYELNCFIVNPLAAMILELLSTP